MEFLRIYESSVPKQRLGSNGDGGYIIVPGLTYDAFFGCGIGHNSDFEKDFISRYPGVPAYCYDGTINNLSIPNAKFFKKNIGSYNSKTETNLQDEMTPYSDIFLKMDIEGHEFRWFQTLTSVSLDKIKQLVIEFHYPFYNWKTNEPDFRFSIEQKVKVLKRLTETHTLVHVHGNNCCGTGMIGKILAPKIFECTYVRKDCQPADKLNTQPIPHPLDQKNVPRHPEIHLSGYPWTE